MRSKTEATFLRPSEAAEITGLSTRAIYRAIERAIERGELRAARLCSRLRIPRAAFDEWVERCAVRAAERPPETYPRVPPPVAGSPVSHPAGTGPIVEIVVAPSRRSSARRTTPPAIEMRIGAAALGRGSDTSPATEVASGPTRS